MTKDIDYYFTPVSPFSYLGHERFAALAQQYAATIRVKPIDLGKVFPVSGGLPLKQRAPQRQAYRLVELARWRDVLGIPLNPQPKYFPVPADVAAKWIIAASELSTECALTLSGALMRAVWAEELDVSDAQVVARIAGEQGLDAVKSHGRRLLGQAGHHGRPVEARERGQCLERLTGGVVLGGDCGGHRDLLKSRFLRL